MLSLSFFPLALGLAPLPHEYRCLAQHINAEIAAGSITREADGVEWLHNTFLAARMRRNPTLFGLPTGSPHGKHLGGLAETVDSGALTRSLRLLVRCSLQQLIAAGLVALVTTQQTPESSSDSSSKPSCSGPSATLFPTISLSVQQSRELVPQVSELVGSELLLPTALSRVVSHYYLAIPTALDFASGLWCAISALYTYVCLRCICVSVPHFCAIPDLVSMSALACAHKLTFEHASTRQNSTLHELLVLVAKSNDVASLSVREDERPELLEVAPYLDRCRQCPC